MNPSPSQADHDLIMVVDETANSFIASILRLKGYEVTHVLSGPVALAQTLSHPPCLIISRVLTIPTTQKAFSEHIRETPQIPYIPILLISDSQSGDLVQCLDSGADDFLRHPVEIDELLARVRSLLRLKHTFDERERITQVREDFLSRLTHDLRTPLVAADRMFDRLNHGKYGALSAPVLQILDSMQQNNRELLHMTNNLLDLYRYESGSKSLSFTEFDLTALMTAVVAELQPIAQEKKLTLTLTTPPPPSTLDPLHDTRVEGVKLELRNALINLVGNALKFTDQGYVRLGLDLREQGYQIKIEDSGCGIHPDDLPQIFDRFYQGNHGRSGSGLGLNLVQQVIQAHHGTIEAQSKLGQGSCMTIWLPRRQASASSER